ncbi:general transcription factor II-I repeat domain-containing protein 2-like [Rhineura floridana]|uniref:general transcription factor II-I repeat domain-containing protein 2-like n=1 Tax=Rhineura floridana TaxID=261503 RepID=UPI002AC85A3F|nr:general transcription factor II-I repeat domain-containing protein 2-like [Rhineura floridana]
MAYGLAINFLNLNKSELRKNKLTVLKSSLNSQQTLLTMFSKEADTTTEASFVISGNIARAKCRYSDGEFVKNIAEVVAVLDPNNTKLQRLIAQTPASCHATERRISQISADVAGKMQNDLKNSLAFRFALDESTDIQDNPQLAVFVCYVSFDVTVKEEMLDLVALKETTRGVDIKNALDRALTNADIPLDKLISVATDGAPAMVGKNAGLIALMKNDPSFPEFLPVHCIIHHEHLAARYFKYENVMKSILEIVNFICLNGKSHRQFKNFMDELELEDKPSDVSFYCIVRWLSTSNVLNRFVDLLEPIITFLEEKKIFYPELENDEWMQDLMFLTDIMNHLQTLNLPLQGKDKIVSDLTQTIFSFQNEIRVFQRDILSRNFSYFPNLKRRVNTFPDIEIKDHKLEEYEDKLQGLLDNFLDRFEDLQKLKPCFAFLVNPFMVDVINDGCPTGSKFQK